MKPVCSRQRQRRAWRTVPLSPYQPPRRLPLGRIVAAIGGRSSPVVGPIPEWGEAILDGMRFKADHIQDSGIDVFQGKVTFGDTSRDSDPLLSTWIVSDLSGGHGLVNINEGTDLNRYRVGTLYTRHPHQITLPRKVQRFDIPFNITARNSYLLGDLFEGTDYDHFSLQDGDIFVFNEASDTWTLDNNSNVTLTPVGPGVAFTGTGTARLFVPCGADGYFTYTGGTVATFATPTFVDVVNWDDKLIGIDTTGQLHSTTDGTTWTSYGVTGKLDVSYKPHRLVVYRDRSDAPTIHVVTDRDVWAFDPAGPSLYRIDDLSFPPRPHEKVAACVWRGDLYISAGMGVYRYNGATVTAIGLDRDDGLPTLEAEQIVWLWPEHNGLYALVNRQNVGHTLHVFTGFGWHKEFDTRDAGVVNDVGPTFEWGYVSFDGNGYRLWWSSGALDVSTVGFYSMELPRDFANPRQLVTASTGKFAIGGLYTLETGRFDANMRGYAKIANSLHVTVAEESTMADVWLQLLYRIDGEKTYRALGTVSQIGKTTLLFGATDAFGVRPGVEFDDIEIKVEAMKLSDETTSFIIEDIVLSFQRVRERSESFVMELDLSASHADNSPEAMFTKLRDLRESKRFFAFQYRQLGGGVQTYRGRISQMTSLDQTGRDTRSSVQVSFIEIPESLGAV